MLMTTIYFAGELFVNELLPVRIDLMTKDAADLHVQRWRDHWALEEKFDEEVEAATYRIFQIASWLRSTTKSAVAAVGLQNFEYDTLHALMVRDTPGKASPSDLAQRTHVSNAGMTGRLDGLQRKGWLKRMPGTEDRRTVEVEITRSGLQVWREAMHLRGTAEDEIAAVLSRKELASLNRLLKKMTLQVERQEEKS